MNLFLKLQLAIALWVFVSPWVLGFASVMFALWSSVLAGAAMGLVVLWEVYGKD